MDAEAGVPCLRPELQSPLAASDSRSKGYYESRYIVLPTPADSEPFPSRFSVDTVKAGISYFISPSYEPLK